MLPTTTTKNLVDAVVTSLERQGVVDDAVHAFVDPGVIQWITPPLSLPGTIGGRTVAEIAAIKVNAQLPGLFAFWERNSQRLRAGWLADPRGTYKGVNAALWNAPPGLSRFLLCPPASHELESHSLVQLSMEVAAIAERVKDAQVFARGERSYVVGLRGGRRFGVEDGRPLLSGFEKTEPYPGDVRELLHMPRGVYAGGPAHSVLDNIRNYVEMRYGEMQDADGLLTALDLLRTAFWHVDPFVLEKRLTTAGRRGSELRRTGYQIKSVRRRWREGEPLPDSAKAIFAEAFQMLYTAPYYGKEFMQSLYGKLVPNFLSSSEFRSRIGHPERKTRPIPAETTLKKYEDGLMHVANLYNLEVPCRPANTLWSKVS